MKLLTTLAIFFLSISYFNAAAQDENPASLTYAIDKIDYKAGDTVYLIINVKMAEGWSLYSSEFAADGPIKFNVILAKSKDYTPAGDIIAYKPFAHYDEVWEAEVKIFEKVGQFRVPIVVNRIGKIVLNAEIEGQSCKDACSPLNATISFDLQSLPIGGFIAADPLVYRHYEVHPKPEEHK